jgi:5'/3'-nucleotidase SurE
MTLRSRRSVWPAALVALVVALAAVGHGQTRSLKILLTNDDGFDANGLKVMQAALSAAGHQVTVVAPATNQSSTSMSMTNGVVKFEKKSEGVWAVYGTPADAAVIGIVHILRDAPPELVVSGTNAGQNLALSANLSGTVSAAIAASRYGIPAIATSAGTGPNADGAYTTAAVLATRMIAALSANRTADGKLLPDRYVITMNVPALPAGELKGVRWTPLSRQASYTRVYSDTGNSNEVRSQLQPVTSAGNETNTDLALFLQGYVTLTLLDGDLGVRDEAAAKRVTSRLSKLALPQPASVR